MHPSSYIQMEWAINKFGPTKDENNKLKVLDIGSYDHNGTYRPIFPEPYYEYTGLDIEHGNNVDIVPKDIYDWSEELETESFDIVTCGQCFEHNEFFWLTMSEIVRVLKKDGILVLIAPRVWTEHRYPVDCYRFFTDGMIALARYTSIDVLHAHSGVYKMNKERDTPFLDKRWIQSLDELDSVLIARKPYRGETVLVNTKTYMCKPSDLRSLRPGTLTRGEYIRIRAEDE